tara:strand:+ start:85 stop:1131 length:1047 start_codon:yes stop_codon:yes gene_type:complete
MRSILVTGGCGFIGSNFIQYTLQKYSQLNIINLDKLTYAGRMINLSSVPKERYLFIKGDICNKDLVDSLFKKYQFQSVIHFAAESHVDRSIDGPEKFVNTNILGTLNLLEHSRKYFRKSKNNNFRFLHISTDEVFGTLGDSGKFNEGTPYDPSSPYSASKAGSDHLVRAWNKTYALPTLITNCSNNYGPYQFPEKLIPLMIINAINGNPLPVYGAGKNIRDWLYVLDHCEAIFTVLDKGKVGQTYNIGGGNEIKNLEVVEMICHFLDKLLPQKKSESYANLINFVEDRPGHDFRYAIDSTKINLKLGWYPKESFESGLEKTIKWYIKNEDWWSSIFKDKINHKRLGIL